MPSTSESTPKRVTFPRRMRLSGRRQFLAVYQARVRVPIGPFMIYALPNSRSHMRLGLAVPRQVGTAVVRNTIKRRLREAFRLRQHHLASGGLAYDLIVSIRRHDPMTVAEYQDALAAGVARLNSIWMKKLDKKSLSPPPDRRG